VWVVPPNNVHVHPQLKNTLSKLISIEILTSPSDLEGKSIKSKLISIEILTFASDLKGNPIESKFDFN
jgi:hypothetical protein